MKLYIYVGTNGTEKEIVRFNFNALVEMWENLQKAKLAFINPFKKSSVVYEEDDFYPF